MAGIAALCAVGLLIGGVWLGRSTLESQRFDRACSGIEVGTPLVDVYRALGRDSYRPGCGTALPCDEVMIDGVAWALTCEVDDCMQLWRRGIDACAVDFDGTTRTVKTVERSRTRL